MTPTFPRKEIRSDFAPFYRLAISSEIPEEKLFFTIGIARNRKTMVSRSLDWPTHEAAVLQTLTTYKAVKALLAGRNPYEFIIQQNHAFQNELRTRARQHQMTQDEYDSTLDELESAHEEIESFEARAMRHKKDMGALQRELMIRDRQHKKELTAMEDKWRAVVDMLEDQLLAEEESENTVAMDKIRLRNIIDQAQAQLAYHAGLVPNQDTFGASLKWRDALRDGSTVKRLKVAKKLLCRSKVPSNALLDLMQSVEAMNLVSEQTSRLRQLGDSVAHEPISDLGPYELSIRRFSDDHTGVRRDGLCDLLDFVYASR